MHNPKPTNLQDQDAHANRSLQKGGERLNYKRGHRELRPDPDQVARVHPLDRQQGAVDADGGSRTGQYNGALLYADEDPGGRRRENGGDEEGGGQGGGGPVLLEQGAQAFLQS